MASGDIALNILLTAQNATGGVFGQLLGDIGKLPPMFTAATAAVVGIGAALGISVDKAAKFQTGLTVLSTGAGELKSNLDTAGQGILQISVDTATSTDQLLNGMFMIDSAGYTVAKGGLTVLKVAAEGARLENSDLGAVAFSLTGLLHDYGMSSNQAAQAMNALIKTESDGKMHMQDLTTSLGNVLPLASTLKIAYPQIGAAIAVMTNSNMTARRATQNLNFELRALSAPGATAVKAMESVGLSAQQVNDTLSKQGLAATIQLITDAVGKKFPESSVAWKEAMKAINGGATGLNVALMLGGSHMKEFIADAANIAAAMNKGGTEVMGWSQIQGTFNFQMDAAKAAVNAIFIEVGMKLLPVLTQLLSFLVPLISRFGIWLLSLTNNKVAIGIFVGILAALAAVILTTVVPALVAGAVATLAALWPLLLLGAAFAALGALIATHMGQATAIFNTVKTTLVNLWNAAQPVLASLWNVLKDIGSFLLATFLPVWKQLQQEWTQNLLPLLKQLWAAIQPLLPVLRDIAGIILASVIIALGLLTGVIGGLIKALAGLLSGVVTVFAGVVQIITGAVQVISGIIQFFVDLVTGHFNKLGSDLGTIWQGIVNIFGGAFKAIGGLFQGLWGAISGFVSGFVQGVIGFFQHLVDVLVGHSLIPDLISGIVTWFASLPGKALSAIGSLLGKLASFFGNLASQAVGWGANILKSLAGGIMGAIGSTIGNAMSALGTFIHDHLPHSPAKLGPLRDLALQGSLIPAQIAEGMLHGLPKLRSTTGLLAQALTVGGNNPGSSLYTGSSASASGGTGTMNLAIYLDSREITNATGIRTAKEMRIQGRVRNK